MVRRDGANQLMRRVTGVGLTGLVLLLAGCGGSSGGDKSGASTGGSPAKTDGPLRVASTLIPGTLDPGNMVQNQDCILKPFYVTLVKLGTAPGADGTTVTDPSKLEPYLASSWKVSDDLKTYEFTLKPGLKFKSGTPVDATAVKYSFERALKLPTGQSFMTNNIPDNIKSVEAPSADQVVVTLRQPDPDLLEAYGRCPSSIVDPTVVKKEPKEYLATHEAGSGPFEMASYTPGESLVMRERPGFAEWYGKPTPSKEINVEFVTDASALLLKARSGDADVVMGLPKANVDALKGKMRVIAAPTAVREQLLLNWATEPFKNVKVRQAALQAIPYEAVANNVAKGYAKLFWGPILPNLRNFNAELAKPITTDVAAAQAAMKESGVKTPVDVEVGIIQGNPIAEQLATIVQAAWKPLGINVKVQQYPTAEFSSLIYSDKLQSAIRNGGPSVASAAYYLGYSMACKVPGTGTPPDHICIPEADKLLTQARAAPEGPERQELYDQIVQLWRAQWPQGFFYNDVAVVLLGNDVKHWQYDSAYDMGAWGK
jgi:peptide/nickel transport system substrate-binding protein